MTKLEELKLKASRIKSNSNPMHRQNNEFIGDLLLEILNNPAIFEDEELFKFIDSITFDLDSGQISDTFVEDGNFMRSVDYSATNTELGLVFEDVPEFSQIRFRYRTTASYFGIYLMNDGAWSDEFGTVVGDGEWNNFTILASNIPSSFWSVGDNLELTLWSGQASSNLWVEFDYVVMVP